ncbi:MAG: cytochrome c3 family protein [Betaproteobacteria bacterium]
MRLRLATVTRNRKGQPVRALRTIEGDSFAIGRGAQCPIFLPDPRVALEHATIFRSEGATRLAAVGTATLLVEGQHSPEIALAPGSYVEVGPYGVTVEVPPPDADLALAVELKRPLPDDLADIKVRSRMSLTAAGLAKRRPAWMLLGALLLLFLAVPVINAVIPPLREVTAKFPWPPDLPWNPGPLAAGHAGIAHDCRVCHELPFVHVRDRTCLKCHGNVTGHAATPTAQADLFGDTRCANCHADHKGETGLVRSDAGLCADCHGDLKRRLPDTKLADARDFAKAHPEFRVTLWRGPGKGDVVRVVQTDKANLVERSGLRFPHVLHLQQSIRGPKGRVVLECRSCHVPDAAGRSFAPVQMTKHCSDCHTLEFEPAVTSRQVPHGSVDAVMLTMQEFYASIALNNIAVDTVDPGDIRRGIPRPAGGTVTEEQRQRAQAWARAKAEKTAQDLFEARVCIVCHEVVKMTGPGGERGGIAWNVAPVRLASSWLPKSQFDHGKHRTYKCEDCHDKVAKSKSSADVNIPDVESCRVCHAGSEPVANKVVSTCVSCHGFHLPGHAPWTKRAAGMPDGAPIALAQRGTR